MLIRFIAPKYLSYVGLKDIYRQQKLTLMYLASLTPKEYDVEIIDEDIKEIPYDSKADIVALSFNSPNSFKAFDIMSKYKDLGVTVVSGGFHTSLFPEKVLEYADAIVVGEAENVWENLLNDYRNNSLKRIYKSEKLCDMKNLPVPSYDFYNNIEFYNQYPLFITRGCPYKCSYCCIKTVYGKSFRKRPVEDVVKHIEHIIKNYNKPGPIPLSFCFVDDNIWGDQKYAKELFEKLIPLKISWYIQGASLNLSDEILELAAKSGCSLGFVGFESLVPENLVYLKKNQNDIGKYGKFIKKIHDLKIAIGAYFMLGLPYDNGTIFDDLLDFMINNRVEMPAIHIYTPIPGTEEFNENDWNGKDKFSKDFKTITDALPIYLPENMTRRDFREKFVQFARNLFSDESIEERFKYCSNIGYKYINKNHQKYYQSPEWDEWILK
jgi:radical SAM superfamily enzyme YgiQ (UPF0313 family)